MYYWALDIWNEISRAQNCRKFAIDGPCDWLNRILMPTLMIICCLLQTFGFASGNNITCLGFAEKDEGYAEEYCWTQGIYTSRAAYNLPASTVPYPGIAPCITVLDPHTGKLYLPCPDNEDDRAYHLWYQWVPFYFLVVGLLYYTPFLVLKGSKLHEVKPLISYLLDQNNFNRHPKELVSALTVWIFKRLVYPRYAPSSSLVVFWHDWGLVVLMCSAKMGYVLVALVHMFATTHMFPIGDWLRYGVQFWSPLPLDHTTHVKDVLFPKVVACRIVEFGPTGQEQSTGMCMLALNVMNQYIFLLLWYLNVLLILLNTLSCLYTFLQVCSPSLLHDRIVNTTSLQHCHAFTRMFGYVGPSGRIILAKMSEHMPGYLLSLIARQVTQRIDQENVRYNGLAPKIKFTRVNGQPSEIARQPLMQLNALMLGIVPENTPKQSD